MAVRLSFLAAFLALGLACFLPASSAQTNSLDSDELVLKNAGIATDKDNLLRYFRLRTLKDGDKGAMLDLVKNLGSESYKEREHATRELTLRGQLSMPFLKEALKDARLEVVRRVELIVRNITTVGPEQPVAAARLLAARNVDGAIETLLHHIPFVTDDWVEEEILASIGRLAIRAGKVDPLLLTALKDKDAGRRAAAVYILGRAGELDQRDTVRQMLADPEAIVRDRAAFSLVGKRLPASLKDSQASDEALVKKSNFEPKEADLLDFLKKRTLGLDDQNRLKQLVKDLGSDLYKVRLTAQQKLVKEGTPALAFLKPALEFSDLETTRRAAIIMEEIRRGPGPALPIAAARLLARPSADKDASPAAAIGVLLNYVPFADDETVEEEVFAALTLLSARTPKIEPILTQALADSMPARRAAAAYVLGRVGVKEHQAGLRKLLDDASLSVRLRTAQALLAANDRTALPRLVALVGEMPPSTLWHVEETLQRLAGDKAPPDTLGDGSDAARKKLVAAWEKWLDADGKTADLARLRDGDAFLGLLTICEYDSANGQPTGQIWEAGRDAKPRWKFGGVMGAMDAQVLPNGRVLVAENSANKITERDQSGAVKWEYATPGNPIACQRLPNGNTFLATYNAVMEITPDKKVVYNHNRGPAFYIFSARLQKNGHVVAMTAQGQIMEFEPRTGKEIRNLNVGPNGGWCSAELLPNGRYLVATMNNGQVREIDQAGQTHWTINYQGAFRATRLPNGNTVVCSMTTKTVAEFNRAGGKVWERSCDGRPWSVRYR